ncbi:MAG: hypothetical protein AB1776_02420 [Bacillota bacterium]
MVLEENNGVKSNEFDSLEEVLDWVDRNQIARRNLTDAQFAVVIGRIYEREKKNQVTNLRQFSSAQNKHSEKEGNAATAKKIAAEFGVGQATVRRAPGRMSISPPPGAGDPGWISEQAVSEWSF